MVRLLFSREIQLLVSALWADLVVLGAHGDLLYVENATRGNAFRT